jgi:hypothetical protein
MIAEARVKAKGMFGKRIVEYSRCKPLHRGNTLCGKADVIDLRFHLSESDRRSSKAPNPHGSAKRQ